MTTYSKTISSPIVILEKLPINFEQCSYIKEEIMISDISDHSDNELRHKSNNNMKLKKTRHRLMNKKKSYKNAKICSTTDKLIRVNNDNLISKNTKNKLQKLQKVHKRTDTDSNSDLHKLGMHKFLSNQNRYPNNMKSPIVVLERLSIKLEQNLLIDDEKKFPYMTNFSDNNNLNIIENHKLIMNKCSSNETRTQESNKVEKNNSIKIKNEIDEPINDDINSDHKESDIIENNILDEEYLINKIKIESNETDLLLNENQMPELIMIKKCSDYDEDNISTENTDNEEYSSKQIKVEEKEDNLLYASNICEQIYDKNSVYEMIDNDDMTDEIVSNNSKNNQNKSISLKEACEQMSIDGNSDLFESRENFNHFSIHFSDISLLLNIPDNSDHEVLGNVINNPMIEENKSLFKYINESGNKITIGLNQQSYESVEKQISYSCKGSKMKLFMEKCVKCNRIQKRIDDKISSRCNICEANVYYECLICRSHYKYPAGIYNHISLKHTNQDSAKPVKCQRCDLEFKAERNMKEHLRYCKVLPYLKCEFCSLMAKRKNCLRKHIRMKHQNDIKAKDIEKLLQKIVENSKELKDQAIKMAETIYGGCSSSRVEPFPITNHIKLYCNRCKGTFKKLLGIDQRSCRICGAQLFMQCMKCDSIYKFRSSMSLHLRSKCVLSDNLAFHCDKCDYITFTKPRLKRHIYRRHTYIDPKDYFNCSNCDRKFKLKEDLRNHSLKCERLQWSNCNFCPYKTNCKENLKMHVKYYHSLEGIFEEKRHTESNTKIVADSIIAYCSNCNLHTNAIEKVTKCQVCKTPVVYRCKRCSLQKQKYVLLRIHVIRNHGEKIYRCPNGCGHSFAYLYDYRQHIRLCGKKPHLHCDRCPFKTKYKHTFLQHKQRNCIGSFTPLRKKKVLSRCYNCGKVFKNKAYLLRHANFCGKPTSFLFCDHCSFRTFVKHILVNHIQSKHAARLFRGINAFHCENCTKVFKNYFVYSRHIEDCRCREKKV